MKAVELTSGGLHRVPVAGLRPPQGCLTAVQKSAEGIVGGGNELGGSKTQMDSPRQRPERSPQGVEWQGK